MNLVEILKQCPSGMELDCTMYEDVYFDYVDKLNIIHCYIKHEHTKHLLLLTSMVHLIATLNPNV